MEPSTRFPILDKKPSVRPSRSQRLTSVLNEAPRHTTTPLSCDSAWSVKLKDAVSTAVRELNVEVLSAKPILPTSNAANHDMVFEMDTTNGKLQAVRSREGTHQFKWL